MQLTLVNFFKKTVPGHLFRGKKRLVKPVSRKSMETLIGEYQVQERNMALLLNPYLTLQQSAGHAKDLKKTEQKLEAWNAAKHIVKMKPHVTLEDRLLHLKVKESWD